MVHFLNKIPSNALVYFFFGLVAGLGLSVMVSNQSLFGDKFSTAPVKTSQNYFRRSLLDNKSTLEQDERGKNLLYILTNCKKLFFIEI